MNANHRVHLVEIPIGGRGGFVWNRLHGEREDICESHLFLAIGSSLVVWPAAGFPGMAKQNGAKLVIINREATEFDSVADLVVHEDIGDVLEQFLD